MPENNLRIGATVDTGEISQGMTSVEELTQKVAQKMAVSFEECSTRTKSAMRNIGEDVKLAAGAVSAEALKVAEATKMQTAAMADLRRAQTIAKDANIDAATSTSILAAAQQKAAAASAEIAAAKRAEASAVTMAAEDEALSQNVVIRSFQRAAASVAESTTLIQEKMIQTAETAKLTGTGISSGFAGLGSLLGAGLAVGFATHFLDELAKVNVELDHLQAQTGVDVTQLAGLQLIVKEMGGDWEAVANGLIRLERAENKASEGSKAQVHAFHELGISMEEIKDKSPEEVLNRVSTAFAAVENPAKLADVAITLFGKGGKALIPILKEQGAELENNMKQHGKLTGITDDSAAAARRWTKDMADLSVKFQSLMIPVMEGVIDIFHEVDQTTAVIEVNILTAFEKIRASILTLVARIGELGKVMWDVTTGNFAAIVVDAKAATSSIEETWKDAAVNIGAYWNFAVNKLTSPSLTVAHARKMGDAGADDEGDDKAGKTHKTRAAKEPKALPQLQTTATNISGEISEFEKQGEARIRINEEVAKKGIEAFRLEREEEMRAAQDKDKDIEQDSAFEVRMGRMTAEQRIATLRQAAEEEYRIRMQALQALATIDVADGAKYQQDLNKQLELKRQHERQIVQLDQQAALQSQQVAQATQQKWQQWFQQFNAGFKTAISGWMQGTQSLAQGFAKMFNGILQSLADFVMGWLLKKAEMWAMDEALTLAGRATQHAQQGAANVAAVTGDAAVAAAGAMAYWSAINPPIAPAMAAVQFAATMAYAPMASFDKGGMVTEGGGRHVPVLAKAGERILTPQQSQNFESMVNQSSSKSSTMHLTYNGGAVNAFDRTGMRSTLRAHADDITDIVRAALQRGALMI